MRAPQGGTTALSAAEHARGGSTGGRPGNDGPVRPPPDDRVLERTVLDLLAARAPGATICPSEAARAVGGDDWRDLMEPARAAARRLVERGDVVITQGGEVVDPATA